MGNTNLQNAVNTDIPSQYQNELSTDTEYKMEEKIIATFSAISQSNLAKETGGNLAAINTNTQQFLAYDDVSTAGYVYLGYAPIGTAQSASAWLIKKLPTSAGQVTYAAITNGIPSTTQIWNNRTSLTYS